MIPYYQIRSPLSQITEEKMTRFISSLSEVLGEKLEKVSLEQYLEEDFALEFQERVDENHVVMRVCTSWATPERNVTAFIEKINKL